MDLTDVAQDRDRWRVFWIR